jgi:FlaA1/EpsC-like NDP-sugar epimerase
MTLYTPAWLEQALGRAAEPEPLEPLLTLLANKKVLVTGGLGSLGLAVGDVLEEADIEHTLVDVDEMDVTDPVQVACCMRLFRPDVILHLAGAKHAPEGELDPLEPARVHIDGTRTVLDYAPRGSVVVTASTCKSCDPETAYGASKLIAERLTLNAGQRVARFHNVVETSGNVFEIWASSEGPIEYAPCSRYFISCDEAVSLLLYASTSTWSGRFAIDPRAPQQMGAIAKRLYPHRPTRRIEPRRGDRRDEPLHARCETTEYETDRILHIHGPHDPEVER